MRRVQFVGCLSIKSLSLCCALTGTLRSFAKPSAVHGPFGTQVVDGGFVTDDVIIDMSQAIGGQYARGLYAKRDIGFGREIMNVPAYAMYIGDEPMREQVLVLTKQIFSKLISNHPEKPYIQGRILTMASGGFSYFTREKDVLAFAESVAAENEMRNGAEYLNSGEYNTFDLQKLPLMLEFNRWEVEYHGRKGICIFPEAQYFNHQCEGNVEISITYNHTKNNFILSARAAKPIRAGEELFINYFPGNDFPLSRLSLTMRKRWGFECTCVHCKSRAIGAVTVIFAFLLLPFGAFMHSIYKGRMDAKQRGL